MTRFAPKGSAVRYFILLWIMSAIWYASGEIISLIGENTSGRGSDLHIAGEKMVLYFLSIPPMILGSTFFRETHLGYAASGYAGLLVIILFYTVVFGILAQGIKAMMKMKLPLLKP